MMTATKQRCQSNDPAHCRHHGTPATQSGISSFFGNMLPQSMKQEPVKTSFNPVETAQRAETASLQYTGEQPKWWKKFAETSAADPDLPSQPELLDVIDSPVGKLAVIWQPDDQEDRNILSSGLGIKACYYKSFKTGEEFGHVKILHKSDETFERSFKKDEYTPFRWKEENSSADYDLDDDPELNTAEQKNAFNRTLWKNIMRSKHFTFISDAGERLSASEITEEHAPDDKAVEKVIAKERQQIEKEMESRLGGYSTGGFVERSRVDERLSGKGYGTALYLYTARKLAEQGTIIRASGIQSQDALKLWSNFQKRYPKQVKTITYSYMGEEKTVPTLDFR